MIDASGYLERELVRLALVDEASASQKAEDIRRAFGLGNITLKASPTASLWAMGSVSELLAHIYSCMKWEVLETRSTPFLTSDCPVHRYYLPIQEEIPYTGLMGKRVQVRFPLSSDLQRRC